MESRITICYDTSKSTKVTSGHERCDTKAYVYKTICFSWSSCEYWNAMKIMVYKEILSALLLHVLFDVGDIRIYVESYMSVIHALY